MRKNTRSFFNTYNIGDEVFYKRNDSPEWKSPGKVVGQGGSVLFIRQGSRYIKVHLCRVQPVHMQNIESFYSDNTPNIESSYSDNTPNIDTNANKQQNDNKNEFETEEEASDNDADKQTSSIQQDSEQSNSNQQVNLSTLKSNTNIIFTNNQKQKHIAKIIGCAGKATGKNKTCYNI